MNKAAGPGQPVTQKIALSVKGGHVECAINGAVVASYEKSAVVTPENLVRPTAFTEFASPITPMPP